ncbi:MAG TPA: hypothetical protein VJV78_20565 [Polyangiales bacterium]|nr:hypothetical protein [Polyangiales bacterium]
MRTCALAILCCVLACADSHRDGLDESSSMSFAARAGGAAGGSAAPASESEVWVGQLWSAGVPLCDPALDDSPQSPTWSPPGKTYRVELVLERDGGHFQIGELNGRTLPESPGERAFALGPQPESFWSCSTKKATEGAEYHLLDLVRTPKQLRFSYSPYEVWDHWCKTEKSPCLPQGCEGKPVCTHTDGWKADLSRRVPVQLTVTPDTLEGQFASSFFGTTSDMRLRRMR